MAHMRRGDFEGAWRVSDALIEARGGAPRWHLPRHLQAVWNGESVEGRRVLVRCYHGLGDTIQFARFAPALRERAREVVFWAQPELLPLLETVRGIDRLLPLHDGTPEVEYDVDVEVMELPHVLRATLATLPGEVPYLHVDAAPRPEGGGLAVGLVWEVGDWDRRRSIPFRLVEPLGGIPGVSIHVLQRGAGLQRRREGFGRLSGADDLPGLASVMRSLGLVASVDSMPAHLAGALGVPVWVALQADADGRWILDREDSPWYPTMRLFRQEAQGDWAPVVERIARGLRWRAGG
jgi:hypothetical protein